jgi:hypothetical protein
MPEREEMGGPFIEVAAFCQTAIQEEGSRQLSIIRVTDFVTVPIPKLPAGMKLPEGVALPVPPYQITLALIIKSGIYKGKGTITVQPKSPTGVALPTAQVPALFEGAERGVQLIMPMAVVFQEEGPYWFEIGLREVPAMVLTKVPLRVMHQEVQIQQLGTPS